MRALKLMETAGHSIDGIIHVGANDGVERLDYLESGARPCIYVEPIDEVFDRLKLNLRGFPGHIAVKAICSNVSGITVELNIASNSGQSSSIFGLGTHGSLFPSIHYTGIQRISTTTVDDLLAALKLEVVPNLMVIDTQGAELKVLQGASKTLEQVDGIFVEVSEKPLYEGSCILGDITGYLERFDLKMRWMELNADGFGDAFYCKPKQPAVALPSYSANLAIGKTASQSSRSIWSKADDPQGAIDGRKDGSFGFHTDEEKGAWWQVDLGETSALREVRIFNRIDAARARSRTLQVLLSNDAAQWTVVHDQAGRTFGGIDGRPLRVLLNGAVARFIRLQLAERAFLHLDEVEVY